MKLKSFISLIVLAAAAVSAVVWAMRGSEQPQLATTEKLLPQLEQEINEVSTIKLVKAGDELIAELKQADNDWTVSNRFDYPADIGKVRKTLIALANAAKIEEKTSNSDYYERLGVQNIDADDAAGTRIELTGLSQPIQLIVGEHDYSRKATYVRMQDDKTAWLVSGNLSLDHETKDWLLQPIVDIGRDRVQQMTIRHHDGEVLIINKENGDQENFAVADIPEGRELSYETVANNVAGVLAGLRLEDVKPLAELELDTKETTQIELLMFDGLRLTVKAFSEDDQHYVYFDGVAFDQAQAERFAPVNDAEDDQPSNVEDEIQQLQDRLQNWVYTISKYKFDNLTKRMEDMLKALESEQPETS